MAKIFVLEDDNGIREVVQMILESEDYKVISFPSVKDFINRREQDIPDLFIMDVMLPDGSGLDVCNQLKSESDQQNIPIIIMSAHAGLEEVKSACNAEDFIQKPFDLNTFLRKVREHIHR